MDAKIALIRWPGSLFSAETLGDRLGLPTIVVGNLFRDHSRLATPQGRLMEPYLRAGQFVPEEILADIVADALMEMGDGWVLFSYPTTIGQARLLTRHGHEPDLVMELVVTPADIADDPYLATQREELLPALVGYPAHIQAVRSYYQDRGTLLAASGRRDEEAAAAVLIETALRDD
jgi:adenylate kinase